MPESDSVQRYFLALHTVRDLIVARISTSARLQDVSADSADTDGMSIALIFVVKAGGFTARRPFSSKLMTHRVVQKPVGTRTWVNLNMLGFRRSAKPGQNHGVAR